MRFQLSGNGPAAGLGFNPHFAESERVKNYWLSASG